MAKRLTGWPLHELIEEFKWVWPRHGGDLHLAAPIFGTTAAALEKRFREARRDGLVNYVYNTSAWQ